MTKQKIVFAVTNDLNYDQRMIRICNSLQQNGYDIILVGRRHNDTAVLEPQGFSQKRLLLFSKKGFFFYFEYNIRLFFYLMSIKTDCYCAIDLDTIIPIYLVSILKRKKRIYDAHEYFSQQKEILRRPIIYKLWYNIEKIFIPKFTFGYTVGLCIAAEFEKLYSVKYEIIRNLPLPTLIKNTSSREKIILYQGAVNEARGFEFLIPAMKNVEAKLLIYGDGNFLKQAKELVRQYGLSKKITFKGKVLPSLLDNETRNAYIAINLVENNGLNQFFSLANKFFDYIKCGVPQITMNFPEYNAINQEYKIAVLIDDLNIYTIASAINRLLIDEVFYLKLKKNCSKAAKELNWLNEEKKLLAFYKNIFE